MIKHERNKKLYYDKYGTQITSGCSVKYADGTVCKVYMTANGDLGTDATNPSWVATGRAFECEHGIYPLTRAEADEVEVVKE